MKCVFWILVLVAACLGQTESPADEEDDLRRQLEEAGPSPVEFIRAVESHLAKFPKSPQRAELEQALVKAAIEINDVRRLVFYGERVLARTPDDFEVLDRVSAALCSSTDMDSAARALKYAQRYEEVARSVENMKLSSPRGRARWQEETDRRLARAFLLQGLANESMGRLEEAAILAQRSYETFPSAEAARTAGRILERMGKDTKALERLADAFAIPDPRNTAVDRAEDRKQLGKIYLRLKGSEIGLGDLMLAAYDRTVALLEQRQARQKSIDPNFGLTDPLSFTLSALHGQPLSLTAAKGKVVVFDFWATWCGPCKAQHPLYEEVKRKFQGRQEVLFVSVNTDSDRELVERFLKENRWPDEVYFEDGLSRLLKISSIPTTVVLNRRGEVTGRLTGFIPDRFVDMLVDRITEALNQ